MVHFIETLCVWEIVYKMSILETENPARYHPTKYTLVEIWQGNVKYELA